MLIKEDRYLSTFYRWWGYYIMIRDGSTNFHHGYEILRECDIYYQLINISLGSKLLKDTHMERL